VARTGGVAKRGTHRKQQPPRLSHRGGGGSYPRQSQVVRGGERAISPKTEGSGGKHPGEVGPEKGSSRHRRYGVLGLAIMEPKQLLSARVFGKKLAARGRSPVTDHPEIEGGRRIPPHIKKWGGHDSGKERKKTKNVRRKKEGGLAKAAMNKGGKTNVSKRTSVCGGGNIVGAG